MLSKSFVISLISNSYKVSSTALNQVRHKCRTLKLQHRIFQSASQCFGLHSVINIPPISRQSFHQSQPHPQHTYPGQSASAFVSPQTPAGGGSGPFQATSGSTGSTSGWALPMYHSFEPKPRYASDPVILGVISLQCWNLDYGPGDKYAGIRQNTYNPYSHPRTTLEIPDLSWGTYISTWYRPILWTLRLDCRSERLSRFGCSWPILIGKMLRRIWIGA